MERKKKRIPIFLIMVSIILLTAGCGNMLVQDKDDKRTPISELKRRNQMVKKEQPVEKKESEIPKEDKAKGDALDQMIAQMSVEEKVGQMFLARVPDSKAGELLTKYRLGGYLFFAKDFQGKTKDEVKDMMKTYQELSKIPLWTAVDEEGGTVVRVSKNSQLRKQPFLSPAQLFKNGKWEAIEADTAEKADLLLSLGINMNLAPVCDVPETKKDFIYSRAFSPVAEDVAEYTKKVVQIMNEKKIASALKHFPGYGNNVDTHMEFAVDKREKDLFWKRDFLPFQAGIANSADCILVSHNIMSSVDAEFPASLSPAVHQLLRKDLQFDGVIMTDDLLMDAVNKKYTEPEAAVLAVLAGNDMLCSSSFTVQIPAVIEVVKAGRIKMEQIDTSVRRVLLWKQKFLGISLGVH